MNLSLEWSRDAIWATFFIISQEHKSLRESTSTLILKKKNRKMFDYATIVDKILFSQMKARTLVKKAVILIFVWSVQHVRLDKEECSMSWGKGKERIKNPKIYSVIVAKLFWHLDASSLCTISVMSVKFMFATNVIEGQRYNEIDRIEELKNCTI